MDELAKIKAIKRSKRSRAYVTGLHSAPAGFEAANLLLRHIKKTSNPGLFVLIIFPDIDQLLSIGSFSALKDAWQVMAKRLKKHLPINSMIAQTQFGLFIQIWDSKSAQKLIHAGLKGLIDDLNRPFRLRRSSEIRSFSLRSYAGYQLVSNDDQLSKDSESLLSKLTIAATSANQSADHLKAFSSSLQKILVRREYTVNNLAKAIEQEQLLLHFQPIFCAKTGFIYGAQTKVIWEDSAHGPIMGTEFTDAAALTGNRPEVARFSIKNALSFLEKTESRESLPAAFKLFISIPFEAFCLRGFDLYLELGKLLSNSKISHKRLAIEIEGNLKLTTGEYTHVQSCLRKIKNLGITICTNSESNLTTLRLLNDNLINQLKWNLCSAGSNNLEEQISVLGSMLAIAKHHNVGLIVGGVDFKQQLIHLEKSKVDAIQGSLFSEHLSEPIFHHYLEYSAAQTKPHFEKEEELIEK